MPARSALHPSPRLAHIAPALVPRAARTAVLLAAAGCGAGHFATEPTVPPRNLVSATPSLLFSPAEVSIAAGDSVTWAFGGVPHTIVFRRSDDSGSNDGPGKTAGGAPPDVPSTTNRSVTRVFTTRGTFAYGCTLHPGMNGQVHVR